MSDFEILQKKRAFNISEAAEYACVSRGTVHNWIVSGLLPFEELPGRGDGAHRFRLIRKAELDRFLGKCHRQTNKPMKNYKIRLSSYCFGG